ncbi:uncharacterized protein TEOVI_000864000 [Trypanosoma equiperdum]|uniref:Uncharacterized protein n=1 Tax=Trypanosoma equiperdum TaxID=5694 RepID=A0A1G4I8P1_TRYEQ|nr:hypothetical protein TEOVI_000864000 [Trypanosoma equiperdum]
MRVDRADESDPREDIYDLLDRYGGRMHGGTEEYGPPAYPDVDHPLEDVRGNGGHRYWNVGERSGGFETHPPRDPVTPRERHGNIQTRGRRDRTNTVPRGSGNTPTDQETSLGYPGWYGPPHREPEHCRPKNCGHVRVPS